MTEIWTAILRQIESKLDAKELKTWFGPTRQLDLVTSSNGPVLTVLVPSRVFADWIQSRHGEMLARESEAAGFPGLEIRFEASASEPAGVPTPAPAGAGPPGGAERRVTGNPRFTFETFVVGSSNQFAHAAARAVAETPSRSYNPLFLYGGVGLGKTHLMHAIAGEVLRRNPGANVQYLSAERFLNDLINALRFERMHEFKRRYRELDVLLMDDVQFIAGKDSTQEEFFHTFNALHDAQKQIVISSDCPPRQIPTLEERLHSRFEWGLIADIQPPDIETKVAILRKKAEAERVVLPENVALFIASKVRTNIRELEGSLIRLIAYASLTGRDFDLALAHEVLRDLLHTEEKPITIEMIQKFVADHYNVKLTEMKARNNSKSVAVPRQIAMYLTKTLTDASLPEIGKGFGGKHHSTVIHSVRKIDGLRKKDPEFDRLINSFVQAFR